MSLLSWNCRGLGNRWTVQELVDLVSTKRPHLVFLMETKCVRKKVEYVIDKLGFDSVLAVDSSGRSGRLALFWNRESKVSLISYSRNHVDVNVLNKCNGPWRFTGFYAHPRWSQRLDSWNLLKSLKSGSTLPWMVMGDFNDICAAMEKKGGNPRPPCFIDGFNEALSFCELMDLGMSSYPFTWEWRKNTPDWVEERLDRAVATHRWRSLFPGFSLYNVMTTWSDHSALLLSFNGVIEDGRSRSFRFENCWLKD
ncbi:unnamed protein product [Cuscuta campestris]|uniref:Endonuclease/exonuclease/phosphatase domain-containing protein n=1 Tax=Cuscuta campestris TaxID=132261 RepID=A0A484K2I2_9ASTE|nr:unnamed protein product [Cuscuta campestris]